MKKSKLLLTIAMILAMWQMQAQVPGTYTDLGTGSQSSSQTLSDTIIYFKWIPNNINFYSLFKLQTQGLKNQLSRFQAFKNVSGTLVLIASDTLQPDSTMRFFSNGITAGTEIYLKVFTVSKACTSCTPAFPTLSVSTQTYSPPLACNSYVQPPCELVIDGDFEYSNAPCNWFYPTYNNPSAFSSAHPNGGFFPCFWNLAHSTPLYGVPGTADYFQACAPTYSTTNGANATANFASLGHTVSLISGNGYTGFYVFDPQTVGSSTFDYREYVTANLSTALVANQSYSISMYARLADVSGSATKDLQVGFSNTQPTQNSANEVITTMPYVVNMSSSAVLGGSWTHLSTTFTPTVGYAGLTIGSFVPKASIQLTTVGTNTNISYYYIDKVSIQPIPGPTVTATASNYTICSGQSTTLTASGASTYTWLPGSLTGSMVTVSPTSTQTYTVTGANIYGCTMTQTTTINVNHTPTLTISPPTPSVCAGSAITLTVSGAQSYTWNPGGTTGTTVAVSPTVTTTYSVTGVNFACSPVTATLAVTVYSVPVISTTFTLGTCSPTTATSTTLTASGGTSYTWSPCSSSCNTSSLLVTPTVQTTYTIQSSNNGCIGITTVSVNPVFCCSSGSVIVETSNTGTALPAGVYTLNHPYTVTSDFTFGGVTIFMGANAEIIVNNNVTLNLTTAHLLGCPNMWKGIRFAGTQGSVVLSKNTMIEDAITAIDLSTVTSAASTYSTYIINSTDATFNKNYTGVAIGTYTNTGYYPSNFSSTVFTCRKLYTNAHCTYLGLCAVNYTWTNSNSALRTTSYTPTTSNINSGTSVRVADEFSAATFSAATLGIPYQNAPCSLQGISLFSVGTTNTVTLTGFKIGDGGRDFTSLNLFDNLSYGIYSINSNVSSKNCAYQEMKQYAVSPPTTFGYLYDGGVGIHCENNLNFAVNPPPTKLEVLSYTSTFDQSSNFFFNNSYGIRTSNVQYVDVEWAMFHSKRSYPVSMLSGHTAMGEYGVYVKTADYRNIKVVNNVASNMGTAVAFYADYKTFHFRTTQYAGAVAITGNRIQADYTSNTTSVGMTQGVLVDNLFNCSGCLVGGNTSALVNVANNNLINVFCGIAAHNWMNQPVSVNTNTITMINTGNTNPQFGIRHENNYGDAIYNNSVTGFGLTKKNVYAIRMADNRKQAVSCNTTTNTYEGFYFTGAMNLCTWARNNMSTHVHGMTLYNTTIGTQGALNSGIANAWNGTWTGHFQTHVNGLDPATGTGGYNSKLYITSGSTTFPSLNDGNLPNNYYKTTVSQSLFTASVTTINTCPSTYTQVPWGGSHNVHLFQKNLDNIANGSYYYSPYVDPNQANGNWEVYREIVSDTSLMTGDSTLRAFYNALNTSILDKFDKAENAMATLDYTTAATQVAAMSPGTTIEQNTKNFYGIYLDAQNKVYGAADDSTLLALASGCPTRDGVVVYQARIFYNSLYDQAIIFDNICDTVTTGGKAGHPQDLADQPISPNFMVYPNPNNGNVYVSVDHLNLTSYDIRVYDVTGKMLLSKHYTDAGIKELNLDFESGIYLVEVADTEGKTNYKQKIVIQR